MADIIRSRLTGEPFNDQQIEAILYALNRMSELLVVYPLMDGIMLEVQNASIIHGVFKFEKSITHIGGREIVFKKIL